MIAFGVVEPGVAYIDRPCAYGVALRRGRVLVVRTPKGCMLPGGGLDAGETHEQALLREFVEETGHPVTVVAFLGEAAQYAHDRIEKKRYRKIGRFYAVALGRKVAPPSEPDHAGEWLPVAEAERAVDGKAFAWAIRRATGHASA